MGFAKLAGPWENHNGGERDLSPRKDLTTHMKLFQMFAFGAVMATGLVMAQVPAAAPAAAAKTAAVAKEVKTKVVKAAPTAAEIADAKAKGMVWVNHNTKVFHKAEAPTYGTTKNGEFMTEAEAVKAGNRMAKEPQTGKVAKSKAAAAEAKK